MADAYEVFVQLRRNFYHQQDLLEYIHKLSGFCSVDMTSYDKPHCISHGVVILKLFHSQFFGFAMHEKSICSYCGDDQSPVQTRFFYQVTVEQILAGMDFYKSMQIEQRDYLATLLLYAMKTDYPRCLLSAGCPGTFCKWYGCCLGFRIVMCCLASHLYLQ